MRRIALITVPLLALAAGCATEWTPFRPAEHLEFSRKLGIPRGPMEWTLVRAYDFEGSALPPDAVVTEGEWEVRDGRLWAVGGSKDRTLLLGAALAPPVRIEFECTNWEDPVERTLGDITLHLNAEPGLSAFAKGYSLTTGSYYNNCSTFYREGKALVHTEYSPVRSGVRHKVRAEIEGGNLRYWLDGHMVLQAWDPEPLREWEGRCLGLRTWNTRMAVEKIRIYQGHRGPDPAVNP